MKNLTCKLTVVAVVLGFAAPFSRAQVSFGQAERINAQWQFKPGDEPGAEAPGFDDAQWRTLNLPHDWSVEGTLSPSLAACTGFLPGGVGWYRKKLTVPNDRKGRKVYLYFEGVYNRSEVFLNGHSLGRRPNGYVSFAYDATPYVRFGEENTVAVRVDHSRSADSRWYTGSGIYRDVWLVVAHPVHIAQWGVYFRTQSADRNRASLSVETEIENGLDEKTSLTVVQQLFDPEGKEVAKSVCKADVAARSNGKTVQEFTLRRPHLWSVDDPFLYRLKTSIVQNDRTVDEAVHPAGIRTMRFDPDKGFFLNGENMKMKGVCIHHDAGALGSAVPRKVWKRRLETLKETGCNAIRMTHNAHAPALYDLCDEMGFLVMDEVFDEWEFPKRKWIEGWNVGTPGFEGSYDFFEEWAEQDLADVVRRDRRHPSVFAWSIGNEVDYPNDPYSHPVLNGTSISQPMFGGYRPEQPSADRLSIISKRLAGVVKRHDPWRPVTAGLAGVVMSNATEYPDALDIAGYNYTEDRYIADHRTYPARIIYGSENRHDMEAWKAVRDNPHIFGQFLWTGIDYLGESGRWPARGFYSGLLDLGGFRKPRGHYRQALWDARPAIYLGTYPATAGRTAPSMDAWPLWNYTEGQPVRVVCYTNCSRAQLLLNGRPVGEMQPYDDRTGIIAWTLPFSPGTLEVTGWNGGREVCRYAIRTSGRPHALTAVADTRRFTEEDDLAHIVLQIVDSEGQPVFLADDEISCRIEGPARLLGLEAGNNTDMGNYRDAVQRAYHGHLLAYIQSTGQPGTVRITFTAPWLKPAEIRLESAGSEGEE
jgi:beta-galactosidase/beta-glucuronidase